MRCWNRDVEAVIRKVLHSFYWGLAKIYLILTFISIAAFYRRYGSVIYHKPDIR